MGMGQNCRMTITTIVIDGLSVLTAVAHLLLVLIALSYVRGLAFLRSSLERNVLAWMFAVSLTATLGSLFLSEIAGIVPCLLCWYQRIAMYPLAVLTAVALLRGKDRAVAYYVLPLCAIGAAIAAWHYGLHVKTTLFPALPTTPCSLDGESCAVPPYWHLGYITIPLMAFTAFALNAIGCAWLLKKR